MPCAFRSSELEESIFLQFKSIIFQTGGTERAPPSPAANATPTEHPLTTAQQNKLKSFRGLFEDDTKAIIWGQQAKAIQGMLDFDYVCRRSSPSVVASTYPFTGDNKQKYYFGQKEILIPAYKSMAKAFATHPDASIMVTFASMRSVFETVLEALEFPQIKVIAIIAEGVPENQTRKLLKVKFSPTGNRSILILIMLVFRLLMTVESPLLGQPPSEVSSRDALRLETPVE